MISSIPVLGTEPASENRIRSCFGSAPGIRFYCKPVTLVRCREIRGENRFSGRVVGKWLCEMTSAFIIKGLRGARALRLFCGRSSFPPPSGNPTQSEEVHNPLKTEGIFIFSTFDAIHRNPQRYPKLGVSYGYIYPPTLTVDPQSKSRSHFAIHFSETTGMQK